jgi:FkbM family methyltransferase
MLPDIAEYAIYMFEPNPHLVQSIKSNPSYAKCRVVNCAVSGVAGADRTARLWGCVANPESVGATLERSKADFDKIAPDDFVDVATVRLSSFMREFEVDDFVVLKLDIEGSEYAVLDDLLATGAIRYVKKLYCEFHSQWLAPTFKGWEARLLSQLSAVGIVPEPWDAL